MQPIDMIYRFDPANPEGKEPPANAEEARRVLERGNRQFATWVDSCALDRGVGGQPPPSLILPCSAQDLGFSEEEGKAVRQTPFAALLGCADARVPAEVIFGQLRNNLFVVRVAGNVLSDECLGSIEYALNTMSSLRVIVVLGHTGCGAVTAAVDTYLDPRAYVSSTSSPSLRKILDRLFVPVRASAEALKNLQLLTAAHKDTYRAGLIETAVVVNVLLAAFHLHESLERLGRKDVKVLYGIFDLVTHRIWTVPASTDSRATIREVVLADAPQNLADLIKMAEGAALWAASRAQRRS